MTDNMLIGVSPDYLYFQGKPPKKVSDFHRPYFLVFTPPGLDIKNARSSLLKKLEENKSDQNPLSRIKSVGEIETYNSFWDFNKEIPVFKVFTEKSYQVPEVSDHLFFDYNLYTAEHDIPYQQRALVDLAVDKGFWLFNTNGFVKKLRVLVYDIETTEFSEGKEDIPIDMIGFSDFEVKINSKASLSSEDFSFDIVDIPSTWEDIEVEQVVSHNVDEEIDNLYVFCKKLHSFDIISGHNIIGFDNYLIYNRVKWLLKNYLKVLSPEKIKVFQSFISRFSRPDKTFHFGVHSEAVQFYPCSFDTYHGVRKFYSFLDDFSLKSVAPFLGVEVKNRIILTPSQIKIDDRTLKYNKQDVQEQLGVTLNLIQQALPLCFTTCMPFDMLLTSGAVSMWDHMSLIRSKLQKKIMPPTCRVLSISQTLTKYFKGCSSKEDIVKKAKGRREQLSKDFIRVLKYGEEMPPWVEDPYIIFNEQAKDSDDVLNYHMPGGMTIKPDKDANSHFIPWYYVVVADVGAMYPTILKALNIGADTVCLAKKDETPDDFIWLKKIPLDFLKKRSIWYRNVTEQDVFADKGYILGVKIDKKPGVVNCSMTGIMNMISRVKKELKQTSKTGDKKELYRLKMMYQSLKGARNAGSVDYSQRIILLKPDGTVDNIKIGEFVDNMINRYGFRVENINGVKFEVADIQDNWYAFSVNKNGKVEIKKIKQAVRHKWNNKLVKIYTKSGSAKVTPNHSIFTIKNGKIEQISAGEINENTLVAHAGRIPQIEKTQEINLIEEICEPGFYAFIEGNDLGHFNGFKKELLRCNVHTLTNYIRIPVEKIRDMNLPHYLLKYITVGTNWRRSSRIPAVIPVDKNLAELLGYYVAEGHTSIKLRNRNPCYYITFSSASEQMHKRIQELFNKIFKVPVYTLNRIQNTGSIVSTVHARIIDHLFQKILGCGTISRNKRIPSQVLSAPYDVKKAFLEAYMKGDGNYKTEMPLSVPYGRFTTNSKSLNEDIITLQRQFSMKTNTYYRKDENTYNTRMIGYFKGKKEHLGDCFAIPPKKIELVNPTSEYVYDISVEDNENFLTSDGCIILHNTHGILSAPTVSGRQFNLWGAAAITTKGQMILSDTLNYLQKKKVRVVYGDSVDSDTDIIIKEDNLVKIVNIKELFSQCNSKLYKKDGHEYKTLSNIKCLSINKNGICEWKKANFIKRHPYNGNILKVRTQRGEISVTMNHSLYTISNGLKEIFCRDIKNKNVNIAHVSKYNSKGRKIKINALKPLLKFNNELNIWLNIPLNSYTKRLLKYHQPRNNSKGKNTYKKFVRMPISKAIQLYKNGIIRDRDIQNAFISSYNGVGKIPVIYEFDEDFARILGAYAAEGSIYIRKRKGMTKEGAHIFVCGHNVELLHKLKRILEDKFKKKFRITSAGIDKNGENFRIQGNSSTTYLFKFVLDCGQGCRNKKVSPYVLSASKNVQKAFIDEYAKGDGYYETKRRVNPLLGIQTKSKKLVEGLSFLGINTNYGFPSVTYRREKSAYHLRFVQYNKYSKKFKNLTGLIPKTIMEIKPTDGYVYDISVQNNNNFVCANGLIPAHNTDGIYLGCSKSAGNIPNLAKALGLSIEKNEKDWVSKPDVVLESIGECNNRWRKELNYFDFELEPEVHDAMIFVKHKNYLIFDNRDDEVEMITKGNNFKGSDKANIARKVLKQIMMEVLRENPRWDDEEEVRKNVKLSIMEKTNEIVSRLDLKKVDIEDLTLVQSVQPAKRYKLNQDGSMSTFGKRAAALEKLLGQPIRTRVKLKFVVTKQPLPGIKNPSKSGVKPIDYMYPVDLLEDKSQIDLDWYKKMIENYVAGAFGLSNVTVTEQKGLDAWM